jgi:hypothetical protein
VDSTNYFVEHGAVLLAALRLWAGPRQKTDADLRALIDSANAATLELAKSHGPDELHASVQLEGNAYAPPRQLHDTLHLARKGLQPSWYGLSRSGLWSSIFSTLLEAQTALDQRSRSMIVALLVIRPEWVSPIGYGSWWITSGSTDVAPASASKAAATVVVHRVRICVVDEQHRPVKLTPDARTVR